jgi:hypothetical protein
MAINVGPIIKLDDEIRNKIIRTNYVPEQQTQVIRQSAPVKEKSLYTDFFAKNKAITPIDNNQKAVFKGTTYSPSNPKKTDIVNALLERTASNVKFIATHPKFALDQTVLHLLGGSFWNPAGIPGATIPFIGGGNSPDALNTARIVGTEKYLKTLDRLKKTYDEVAKGTGLRGVVFPDNSKTLSKLNIYTPKKLYTKDSPVFGIKGNNIVVNYKKAIKDKDTTFGNKSNIKNDDGEWTFEYSLDQYFTDKDRNDLIYSGYQQQPFTPRRPKEDNFQSEYSRLTKIFYAVSNIKIGNPTPQQIRSNTFESSHKRMYFNCGLETPSDSIQTTWGSNTFVGGSESIYTYGSAKRSTSLKLMMFADIKDASTATSGEPISISTLQSYKNKIEWLMQHSYPSYHNVTLADGSTTASQIHKAPYIRLTLGNLFKDQPCIIDNIMVAYKDVWETDANNIIPIIADVTLTLTILHSSSPSNSTTFLTGR